jgi:hypothetical protein
MTGTTSPPQPEANPPPPSLVDLAALTFMNLMSVSIFAGFIGIPTLYCASFFATIGGVVFSDTLYFRQWGLLGWCGLLLDRHLGWFVCYIASLIFGPIVLGFLLRPFGFGSMVAKVQEKYGSFCSGRKYPGQTFIRAVAAILCLPYLPTVIAAMAGFMIVLLALALLALYAAVELGRMGGFRYLITRTAVKHGVRDALGRRNR